MKVTFTKVVREKQEIEVPKYFGDDHTLRALLASHVLKTHHCFLPNLQSDLMSGDAQRAERAISMLTTAFEAVDEIAKSLNLDEPTLDAWRDNVKIEEGRR